MKKMSNKEPVKKYTLDLKESVYEKYALIAELEERDVSYFVRSAVNDNLPEIEKRTEKLLAERARKK